MNAVDKFDKFTCHTWTLICRCGAVSFHNPLVSSLMYIALPLILGILVGIATKFVGEDYTLFAFISMFWLGINQTNCQFVEEKEILLQERSRGVNIISFLVSKFTFFIALTFIQTILIYLPRFIYYCFVRNNTGELLNDVGFIILALFMGGLIGTSFGLFISAIFCLLEKGTKYAILASVLITLPQILFCDKIVADDAFSPENVADDAVQSAIVQSALHLKDFTASHWYFLQKLVNDYSKICLCTTGLTILLLFLSGGVLAYFIRYARS